MKIKELVVKYVETDMKEDKWIFLAMPEDIEISDDKGDVVVNL